MARIQGVRRSNPEQFRPTPVADMQKWVAARCNGGMITEIDPADLEPGTFQFLKNATCRFDKTSRRPGTILYGLTKPDSNYVLKFVAVKSASGVGRTYRFTPSSVYRYDLLTDAWIEVTGGLLLGGTSDRIEFVNILDRVFFSNNGADNIQEIDTGADTYADLATGISYRYITGFANRLVGAALRGVSEVQVGWSGSYPDLDQWHGAVESSGSTPLYDSPGDLSDFITGIFGLTNVMVVLRQRSVWTATKQPIESNPFYFSNAIPGVGCDSPYSASVINGGLAWMDRRTRTVYAYAPGSSFEDIGSPISRTIMDGIEDPFSVFGGFDPFHDEYHVCIPQVSTNIVKDWVYNFKTKTWCYNEYPGITTIGEVEVAFGGGLTIDQLTGTINGLTDTIDQLSPPGGALAPKLIIGRSDGTLVIPYELADTDYALGSFSSVPYTTEFVSKSYTLEEIDEYVAKLLYEVELQVGGLFSIQYSLDNGQNWITAKNISLSTLHQPRIISHRRNIKARRFMWRLIGQSGIWDLLSYEIWHYPAGQSVEER